MTLEDRTSDRVLDVRGQICPYPLLNTRETLKEMSSDEVLKVNTDHQPAALETLPNFCRKKGYNYNVQEEGDGWSLLIEKKE